MMSGPTEPARWKRSGGAIRRVTVVSTRVTVPSRRGLSQRGPRRVVREHADGPDRAPGQGHRLGDWRTPESVRVTQVPELPARLESVPRLLSTADSFARAACRGCRPQGGGRPPRPTGGPARDGVILRSRRPAGFGSRVAAGLRTELVFRRRPTGRYGPGCGPRRRR